MIIDKEKIRKIAEDIEKDWLLGGLSDGLYYDYAFEIVKRYIEACRLIPAGYRRDIDEAKI